MRSMFRYLAAPEKGQKGNIAQKSVVATLAICLACGFHFFLLSNSPGEPGSGTDLRNDSLTDSTFRYKLAYAEDDKIRLTFENAPSFVHVLTSSPPDFDEKLKKGSWLVLACGVFSQTDINSIELAVECARGYRGKLQLGVRPFRSYEEIKNWFPEYGDLTQSPVWVIYKDGVVQGWTIGWMWDRDLQDFLNRAKLK